VIDARTDRSGVTSDGRRQSIIDAAVTVFAEHGYAGASTREIAEGCQLKQGHLYYYFPAKQDILYTIVAELHDSFLDGMVTWKANAPEAPVDVLRAVLTGHVSLLCRRNRETFVSYENFRFLRTDLRSEIVKKRLVYELRLRDLIDTCGARALDVPGEMVTKAVLGVVNWPYQWYAPDGPTPVSSLASWLADLCISTLGLIGDGGTVSTPRPRRPALSASPTSGPRPD
jgi:AcrR family transcriptional regulator